MPIYDKAGTEITVGCRVAEADFSFGDGVVESVTVPTRGGGCNVGVKWDKPLTPPLGGMRHHLSRNSRLSHCAASSLIRPVFSCLRGSPSLFSGNEPVVGCDIILAGAEPEPIISSTLFQPGKTFEKAH